MRKLTKKIQKNKRINKKNNMRNETKKGKRTKKKYQRKNPGPSLKSRGQNGKIPRLTSFGGATEGSWLQKKLQVIGY